MPRKGIQLAVPFEEKRLSKWQPPYIVQPKYDGERCRGIPLDNGSCMLLSSEENVFFSVPHITNLLSSLNLGIELDGELYSHELYQEGGFELIHSIVSRTVNLHPRHKEMQLHLFDIVDNLPQIRRIIKLCNIKSNCLRNSPYIRIVPYYICNSLEDIMRTYDLLLNKGYEGIVVRHLHAPYIRKRSTYMMKFKAKKEDIYDIIGFKEEIDKEGNPKDSLGALVCRGDDETEFSVGSGFTKDERNSLWRDREKLRGRKLKVQYQHLTTGKKVPRFPVALEVINGIT